MEQLFSFNVGSTPKRQNKMRVALFFSIFSVVFTANASERYTWLCGGRHEVYPLKYRTEFFVTVDLNTIREDGEDKYVQAYLETTKYSKIPENGFADLAKLKLLRLEESGDETKLDVEAHNLSIN